MNRESIAAAAFAFERANGNELGEYEAQEIKIHDFDKHRPEDLVDALVLGIGAGDSPYRLDAYWALSKRHDPALLPFFRAQLATEVDLAPDNVFQLLIALDNLEEHVFSESRGGSYSADEMGLNLRDAKAYLDSLNAD